MAFPVGTAAWRGTRRIARSSSTRLPRLRLCMASLGGQQSLAQGHRVRRLPPSVFFLSRHLRRLRKRLTEQRRDMQIRPIGHGEAQGIEGTPAADQQQGHRSGCMRADALATYAGPRRDSGQGRCRNHGVAPGAIPQRLRSSLPQTCLKRVAVGCTKQGWSSRGTGQMSTLLSPGACLPLLQSFEGETAGDPRVRTRGCIPCLRWRQKPVWPIPAVDVAHGSEPRRGEGLQPPVPTGGKGHPWKRQPRRGDRQAFARDLLESSGDQPYSAGTQVRGAAGTTGSHPGLSHRAGPPRAEAPKLPPPPRLASNV